MRIVLGIGLIIGGIIVAYLVLIGKLPPQPDVNGSSGASKPPLPSGNDPQTRNHPLSSGSIATVPNPSGIPIIGPTRIGGVI